MRRFFILLACFAALMLPSAAHASDTVQVDVDAVVQADPLCDNPLISLLVSLGFDVEFLDADDL